MIFREIILILESQEIKKCTYINFIDSERCAV
jgi:hypothetical protein